MQKISSFHHFILEVESTLESHDQNWPGSFLNMPPKNIFYQLLAYVNLYKHAQNQAISFICFGD